MNHGFLITVTVLRGREKHVVLKDMKWKEIIVSKVEILPMLQKHVQSIIVQKVFMTLIWISKFGRFNHRSKWNKVKGLGEITR